MRNIFQKAGILGMSVVVMAMAVISIILLHMAKILRKGFYHG